MKYLFYFPHLKVYAPKEVDYRRLAVTNHTKTKLVQITQEFLFAYDILSTL